MPPPFDRTDLAGGLVSDDVTVPVLPAGRGPRSNLRARRGGEIRIGLVDVPGRSVDDRDLLSGDELAAPVHWWGEADHGMGNGQGVTLQLRLPAVEVFGFSWA